MRVASKAARFYERVVVTPRLVTLVLGACWSSGLRLVKALCPVLSQIVTFRWSTYVNILHILKCASLLEFGTPLRVPAAERVTL